MRPVKAFALPAFTTMAIGAADGPDCAAIRSWHHSTGARPGECSRHNRSGGDFGQHHVQASGLVAYRGVDRRETHARNCGKVRELGRREGRAGIRQPRFALQHLKLVLQPGDLGRQRGDFGFVVQFHDGPLLGQQIVQPNRSRRDCQRGRCDVCRCASVLDHLFLQFLRQIGDNLVTNLRQRRNRLIALVGDIDQVLHLLHDLPVEAHRDHVGDRGLLVDQR